MLENGNKERCGAADDIVAYLYNELAPSDRSGFESHLVDCMECTDEFAGISNARFSVFEWHREEFVPLETPEIVIPYDPKARPAVAAASEGWFAGLRDLVNLSGWSTAAVAAAVLIVCVGAGFFALRYVNNSSQQAVVVAPVTVAAPPAIPAKPEQITVAEVVPPKTANTTIDTSSERQARPVRAAIKNQKPSAPKTLTANVQKTENVPANRMTDQAKKPVLSSLEDDDDGSLRLADLVDDGGV